MRKLLNLRNSKIFYFFVFLLSCSVIFLPFFFKVQLEDFESLGLLGIFLINFFTTATLFLPVPGILSIPVGAQLYHPVLVALASALGSVGGESISFLFGHSSHEVLNLKKHKILYAVIHHYFKKYGVIFIFIVSFIPNPLIDGVGIIAGLSAFPFHKFLIAVFFGRFVRNLLIAFVSVAF